MKYEVTLKRMVDHKATVTVEAETEDDATEQAMNLAKAGEIKDWELESEDFEIEDSSEVPEEDDEDPDDEEAA